MSIPMSIKLSTVMVAAVVGAAMMPTASWAQANVMKECGAEYQSAKAANSLGGKNWQAFLSECRTRHSATATPASTTAPAAPAAPPPASTAAAPPPPAPKTASTAPASTTPATKPATGGRAAMLSRERECGTEWKAQKIELRKTRPDLKWPQYWSECNKRLKAAAGQ